MAMLKDERIKGFNFGFMAKNGYYDSQLAKQEVDGMAALGVQWVAVICTVMQETYGSTRLYRDFRFTPGDDELVSMIGYIHKKGMRVMLKPMIECLDSTWRGHIQFPENEQIIQGVTTDYWGKWFESFNECLMHYARICEKTSTEVLCMGCEMVGTESQSSRWMRTINNIRSVYRGNIAYQADYRASGKIVEEWFEALDLIGHSFYFPVSEKKDATVKEMAHYLKPVLTEFKEIYAKFPVPFFFGECGCRSVEWIDKNTAWDYRIIGKYDPLQQSKYFEAVLEAFDIEPWWKGMLVWKWDEQQERPQFGSDPKGDTGFTVKGKPAATVLKRWFEK